MLYYEICSSKISVCTVRVNADLHRMFWMNTRLKRGYTALICCSPLPTPPFPKARTHTIWNRVLQKKATSQYSTEDKTIFILSHCGGTAHHPHWWLLSTVFNDKHWSVGPDDITDHGVTFLSTDKLWVHFPLLRSVQMGPVCWFYSNYNIN